MKKFKICLAANYPQHPQDCEEQCDDCTRLQHELENPNKMNLTEFERLYENYTKIIKKTRLDV